ncbi:MAG TPA: hypothetical protein VIR03_03585 [Candidatus Saccharimonadales bacterium]
MRLIRTASALLALAVVLVVAPAASAAAITPGLAAGWQDSTQTAANAIWYSNPGATNGANEMDFTITPSAGTLSVNCSLTYLQYKSIYRGGWMNVPASVGSVNCSAGSVSAVIKGLPAGYQARLATVVNPTGVSGTRSVTGTEIDLKNGVKVGGLTDAANL